MRSFTPALLCWLRQQLSPIDLAPAPRGGTRFKGLFLMNGPYPSRRAGR